MHRAEMLPIVTGVCVWLLGITKSCATRKTAEPIEMQLWECEVGWGNELQVGSRIPQGKEQFWACLGPL